MRDPLNRMIRPLLNTDSDRKYLHQLLKNDTSKSTKVGISQNMHGAMHKYFNVVDVKCKICKEQCQLPTTHFNKCVICKKCKKNKKLMHETQQTHNQTLQKCTNDVEECLIACTRCTHRIAGKSDGISTDAEWIELVDECMVVTNETTIKLGNEAIKRWLKNGGRSGCNWICNTQTCDMLYRRDMACNLLQSARIYAVVLDSAMTGRILHLDRLNLSKIEWETKHITDTTNMDAILTAIDHINLHETVHKNKRVRLESN